MGRTIATILDDDDWAEAFKYANPTATMGYQGSVVPFTIDDVKVVIALVAGQNDGDEWLGVFHLKDGRYASLRAGCDYTGWG